MEASFTQEELWQIQSAVRDHEDCGCNWERAHMQEVHSGILYLKNHPHVVEVKVEIDDVEFWWHVEEQIKQNLTVGTDKMFGRNLLTKIFLVLEGTTHDPGIPDLFYYKDGGYDDSDPVPVG